MGARGDNTEFFLPLRYRKIVWKLIFYPINASANTISHDFFSTVHTFPIIQLIFLGPLLNWFCWVHLEPVAIAELHKFDFFFFFEKPNQSGPWLSCKDGFHVMTKGLM